MDHSEKIKNVILHCLGIFMIVGLFSLNALTISSMFTSKEYALVYIVLIIFTALCTIALYKGTDILMRDLGRSNTNSITIKNKLSKIFSLAVILILFLVLINLISIFHNADILDDYFGFNDSEFRLKNFTGHIILEVIYFIPLLTYLKITDNWYL